MIGTIPELISALEEALARGSSDNFALYDEHGKAFEITDVTAKHDGAPVEIEIVRAGWQS